MRYELPESQDRAIWDIWLSMHHLPAMAVADELGVFETMEKGPATPAETARILGLNGRATKVLFSMLAALRLLTFRDERYELADVTRTYLLPRSPNYWGPLLRALGIVPQRHMALIRALRAAEDRGTMMPGLLPAQAWESGQMDQEQAESVSRVMHCHSLPASVGAARHGNFDGVTRLLDVGGGSGCFSIAIAQHFPQIRCSVLELPAVCEVARRYIEEGGVADRVDTIRADMFGDSWPGGYDGILFSNVFHDWNAQTNLTLARRAYSALQCGGRIFLHEMLLAEDGSGPISTASFSVLMLISTHGVQYSQKELGEILTNAGFVDIVTRETYGYFSVVSGRKP